MAQKQRPEKSLNELRQEIAHTRDRLAQDLSGLGYELNFSLKFKKSFQRHSKSWGVAAALLGLILTIRSGGKQKVTLQSGGAKKKAQEQKKGMLAAGLAMGGLRLLGTMARPMIVSYLTKRVGSYAGRAR